MQMFSQQKPSGYPLLNGMLFQAGLIKVKEHQEIVVPESDITDVEEVHAA